ncbi:MAG: Fe-S-containing hydro-lyase [Anaerolineae bacterium]|nr:Fe-S-containing hydro-lyase [Anaerolineae bacterium]
MQVQISTPLTDEVIAGLRAGDPVSITGTIYVARDAAHQRLVAALEAGQPLPFDLRGQVVYYMGPSPAPPGRPIGSAGPTTSYRMDPYTPALLAAGLKGMIGKGNRSQEVRDALVRYRAVYLATVGGAAALIARSVRRAEVIAYPELGPEAVQRLEVADLPAIVINDVYGGDAYEAGKAAYRLERAG